MGLPSSSTAAERVCLTIFVVYESWRWLMGYKSARTDSSLNSISHNKIRKWLDLGEASEATLAANLIVHLHRALDEMLRSIGPTQGSLFSQLTALLHASGPNPLERLKGRQESFNLTVALVCQPLTNSFHLVPCLSAHAWKFSYLKFSHKVNNSTFPSTMKLEVGRTYRRLLSLC